MPIIQFMKRGRPITRIGRITRGASSLDGPGCKFEEISPQAWRQGADLAIELLEEINIDQVTLEDSVRDGRPQDNAVYRFMCKARQGGEPQLMAFCAVLSEYVGSAADGSCLDVSFVAKLARRPVAQAVRS